ncbi:hypothetical protein ACIOK4_00095 [Streptomyces bottropensis]|uniref:hypothetical protein n=1 Tax=Streptomyces bottropensis TaxID=42235 RepID=UPI0037F27C58
MPNLFVSLMRTLVPYGVALVLTATGWLGIPVDSEAAAGAVSLALGAAYYLVFRGLEEAAGRMAWQPLQTLAGVLLGWARPPQYPNRKSSVVTIDLAQASPEQLQRLLRDAGRKGPR